MLTHSSIRLWAITGQVLLEMVGHTSLVYSVDAHSSGLVASGGEDCFLKIWKGNLSFNLLVLKLLTWQASLLLLCYFYY